MLKVRPPAGAPDPRQHEADLMSEGARLISFIWPAQNKELVERLAARKATVLAMDTVPRITRAQKMDALSRDGEHRRLPRRDRGGAPLRPLLRAGR